MRNFTTYSLGLIICALTSVNVVGVQIFVTYCQQLWLVYGLFSYEIFSQNYTNKWEKNKTRDIVSSVFTPDLPPFTIFSYFLHVLFINFGYPNTQKRTNSLIDKGDIFMSRKKAAVVFLRPVIFLPIYLAI